LKFDPNVTAEFILSLGDDPERLFSSPEEFEDEFKVLARLWHPDQSTHPKADDVASKINVLRDLARKRAAAGHWVLPYGELIVRSTDGRTWKVPFSRRRKFDMGEVLYGPKVLAWAFDRSRDRFYEAAKRNIKDLRYSSGNMEKEFSRLLPKVRQSFVAEDGRRFIVIDKTKDVFSARDLLDHLGGRLDPRHAAWFTSRLLNIACYLEWSGTSHNSINMDTVFVSPEMHSVLLLGGWQYATAVGSKVSYVPGANLDCVPSDVKSTKVSDTRTDRLSLRALAREMLGDRTGMTLIKELGVPEPMASFLRGSLGKNSIEDYANWQGVLQSSFGPKRFVKLEIPESAIYHAT
jgi:hypothetical protein